MTEKLFEKLLSYYQKECSNARHSQTIGILLHLDFPAIIESDGLITYCSDAVVTNTSGAKPEDVAQVGVAG